MALILASMMTLVDLHLEEAWPGAGAKPRARSRKLRGRWMLEAGRRHRVWARQRGQRQGGSRRLLVLLRLNCGRGPDSHSRGSGKNPWSMMGRGGGNKGRDRDRGSKGRHSKGRHSKGRGSHSPARYLPLLMQSIYPTRRTFGFTDAHGAAVRKTGVWKMNRRMTGGTHQGQTCRRRRRRHCRG